MNDLQVFDFGSRQIRIFSINNEPWFSAKDVSDSLGYSDSHAMTRRIDTEDITTCTDISSGQRREVLAINEAGVYASIFGSKKEEAKRFKKWVTHEVLPSIRKSGSFSSDHIINQGTLSAELILVKSACEVLRANEGSALMMLHSAAKRNGIDPIGLLPAYTSEPLTISLTELLKRSSVKMSAIKANKILIEKGYLETLERPGRSRGDVKTFKSFTEEGLKYGKNLINPQNQRDTQPHFFEDVDISELLN